MPDLASLEPIEPVRDQVDSRMSSNQGGTSIQPEALMIAMVMPAERSRVIAGRNSDTHDVR